MTIIGVILLLGIIAIIAIFMTRETKPVTSTPIIVNIPEEEEEEEEEEPTIGPAPPAPPAPSAPPRGRYVRLEQTVGYDADAEGDQCDKSKVINVAEIEVFDTNGTNLAADKAVSGSSQESSTNGYFNLTDGIKTNFTQTACLVDDETNDYLQIDLGSVEEIKSIVVTNRRNTAKHRAVGLKLIVSGGDGDVESPVITTIADTYTLTFPENTWS
jgi:hypothetical protein